MLIFLNHWFLNSQEHQSQLPSTFPQPGHLQVTLQLIQSWVAVATAAEVQQRIFPLTTHTFHPKCSAHLLCLWRAPRTFSPSWLGMGLHLLLSLLPQLLVPHPLWFIPTLITFHQQTCPSTPHLTRTVSMDTPPHLPRPLDPPWTSHRLLIHRLLPSTVLLLLLQLHWPLLTILRHLLRTPFHKHMTHTWLPLQTLLIIRGVLLLLTHHLLQVKPLNNCTLHHRSLHLRGMELLTTLPAVEATMCLHQHRAWVHLKCPPIPHQASHLRPALNLSLVTSVAQEISPDIGATIRNRSVLVRTFLLSQISK